MGHEFDGIATGVQDLLITDMASNAKIRIVDRSSIDAVLREQNMVKADQVDAATAVRLGMIMGARYAVIGGFISDDKGNAVLTVRTVDMETTQIANREKITGKSDDVLGMIGQLSTRMHSTRWTRITSRSRSCSSRSWPGSRTSSRPSSISIS